jgi:hypothetical protein
MEKKPRVKVEKVFNTQAFLVCILMFVLFTIYFGGHIWSVNTRQTAEQTRVVLDSIDNIKSFEGVIIRREQLFRAEADGVPVWEVADGTRVRVGDLVCGIHDAEVVEQLNRQIAELSREALEIQDFRGNLSTVDERVKELNAIAAAAVDEHSSRINAANPQTMYNLRNRLETVLSERNELLLNENRGTLSGNIANRNMYGEQLQQAKHDMATEVSGVVSLRLDGMEEVLTVNNLPNLTIERTRQKIPAASVAGGAVSTGDPLFKILTSNTWYIVSYMDKAETVGWAENMRRTIYILKNGVFTELETRVHILQNAGEFSYVVFSTNSRVLDFIDMRSVVFRTESGLMEGLRIPNTAIAEMTLLVVPNGCVNAAGKVTVINPNGRETAVDAAVVSSDGEFSYLTLENNRLRLGNILVNHETGGIFEITEVRIRRGVFLNNIGSTDFREINMDGSVRNAEFTILCRSANPNIRMGDNIIKDVRNVEDRQLVY